MSYANSLKSFFNANRFVDLKIDEDSLDTTCSFDNKGEIKQVSIPFSSLSSFIRSPTGNYAFVDVLGSRQAMGTTRRARGHAEIEKGCLVPVSELLKVEKLLAGKVFERINSQNEHKPS